jgi:serine/threonine protein kinase
MADSLLDQSQRLLGGFSDVSEGSTKGLRNRDALEMELNRFCCMIHGILTPQTPILLAKSSENACLLPALPAAPISEHFMKAPTSYHVKDFLGKGQAAMVYRCDSDQGHPLFALKILNLSKSVGKGLPQRQSFLAYQLVLTTIEHPNVVQYYGWKLDDTSKAEIITEFCDGGTLQGYIASHDSPAPGISDPAQRYRWIKELLQALYYLHSHGIVHRDLKPSNIFLHKGMIKIGDFGSARIQQSCCSKPHQTRMSGTAAYTPPEAVTGKVVYELAGEDIWALGCTIYQMATGKHPWIHIDNEPAIYFQVGSMLYQPDNNCILKSAESYSGFTDLERICMERCLQIDPRQRANSRELLMLLN